MVQMADYITKLMEFNDKIFKNDRLSDVFGRYYGNITTNFQDGKPSIYGYGRKVKDPERGW